MTVTAAGRRLSTLLDATDVRPVATSGPDPEITGIGLDSRRIEAGHLFCGLRGLRSDGVDFVPEARRRGARAVLAEVPRPEGLDADLAWIQVADARRATAWLAREWHGRPDEKTTLVGVTGTNGKTSVTYLVESMAREAARNPGRIGTVSYAWGSEETVAARTTPEATDLYALLASMVSRGAGLVVMEVSSHALALSRVSGARFSVAALLNLGRDHLDFHGDMEGYLAAKARLIEDLSPEAVAVLPADDPRCLEVSGRTRATVATFGRDARATVRLAREHVDGEGSAAVLETPKGRLDVRSRLLGRANLENIAAAAACALAAGLPADSVVAGAASLERIPGRLDTVSAGQPFAVLVDYAHTDTALARLLSTAREIFSGRVIVVFGCGGERDRGKRPAMGRIAAEGADLVLITSDNPRGENPERILGEIEEGTREVPGASDRCRLVVDRSDAIAEAIRVARPGDVVLIAGKGHETMQCFADRVVASSDHELAREALARDGWRGGERAHA